MVCSSHFKGSMGNFLARESKLIAKIEEEKQEQDRLDDILTQKMKEAQSLSLIEKSQILTEMLMFQKTITRTISSLDKSENDLQTLYREREEIQLKSEIERVKQEQDILNEMLNKKMQKAKSLPLVEKSQILTEMLSFQDRISKTTGHKKMLEERLDTLQKVKEDALYLRKSDGDVETSSIKEEIDALHELGQEISTQLAGEDEGAGGKVGELEIDKKKWKNLALHENECPFCHLQYACRKSLNNHWRRFKEKCMTKNFCKEDHVHDVVVKKFSTKERGLVFLNTLAKSAPFKDEYTPKKDENILTCRCTLDCPAKITLKAVQRQNPQRTIEYVLQACVGHEPSQPPQVLQPVEEGQQL